ncbi:MAG: aspartate/glutamate racemase family protein [Syntrophothermus sp.]
MKKIGLIGGMGPESTLDYYKELINSFKEEGKHLDYPEIIIYSLNLSEFIDLMKRRQFEKIPPLLLEKLRALKNAGAEFAAISANTPHLFFDELQKNSPLPLISIVEATCETAKKKGLKRPGLLGTGFTMESDFYQEVFRKNDMEVIVPGKEDRLLINHRLFTEIELGIFREETKKELEDIIGRMITENQVDSMILGCTEFPLILTEKTCHGIPLLNTTKIHVDAIVEMAKRG